jgi:hypothetical protein
MLLHDSLVLTKSNDCLSVCGLSDTQIAPKSGRQVRFVLKCIMIINMELDHFHLRFSIHTVTAMCQFNLLFQFQLFPECNLNPTVHQLSIFKAPFNKFLFAARLCLRFLVPIINMAALFLWLALESELMHPSADGWHAESFMS